MHLPKKGRTFGFTLVELMVTIAVAAVLLVLATPSFIDFMDKSRLRGVAENSVDFIAKARAESVKQGRNVAIAFRGTTTAWCIGANAARDPSTLGDAVPAVTACACNTTPANCLVSGQQSTFDTTSTNGVAIKTSLPGDFTFDSRLGTVLPLGTTTATLTSPRGTFDLRLTVTPLGQASLCVPTTSKRANPEFPSC